MDTALIIRGRFANKAFISNDPMPDVEGLAELIVYSKVPAHEERDESMFDFFGKARQLRSAADIDSQVQEERQAWNGP